MGKPNRGISSGYILYSKSQLELHNMYVGPLPTFSGPKQRFTSRVLFLVLTWRHQILEFKTGRPANVLSSFKERLPKYMSFHTFLTRHHISLKIEQFQFSSASVSDIKMMAVTELFRILKVTLWVIFNILNNLSLRRNIYLNIRKFTNKPLFWQKLTPDVFSYLQPPC